MSAEDTALQQARETGVSVPIPEKTTETESAVANPDGTIGLTRSAFPVRVKQDGRWADLDATLVAIGDGTLRPKATSNRITFSGGGTTPLATLVKDGKTLALTWPGALPTPHVSGASATYAGVFPDVDLKVTTTVEGGFSQVLVVKTPAAAADPRLATLTLGTTVDGVTVSREASGNLVARDADQEPVFAAPEPLMWDSNTTPAPASTTSAVDSGATGDAALSSAAPEAPTAEHPGGESKTAPVPVSVIAQGLTLVPDQALLTGPETQFPVYIDPAWVPVDRGSNLYTWVQSAYPGTPGYGRVDYDPGVGYQQWRSITGLERSFWRIPVGLPGKVVKKAHFYATETYSAAFSCTDTYPVTLYLTGVINTATDWNSQPGTIENWGTLNVGGANRSGCGNRLVDFDVTGQIAARAGWTDVTVGLRGNESQTSSNIGFKRFAKNASLYIEYNTPPYVPWNLAVTPTPQNPACGGWIGATNPADGGVRLSATIGDPDGHAIDAQFHLWDATEGGTLTDFGFSGSGPSPHDVSVSAGTLKDGHRYDWYVRTGDFTPEPSAFAQGCSFSVDKTPPSVPAVVSTDFPPSGSLPGPTKRLGDTGRFTARSGDTGSGIDHYEYSFNTPIPVGGGGTWRAPGADGSITVDWTPAAWGTNILHIQAVDKAGNRSQQNSYAFYVPDNPSAPSVAGDITGDGSPDLVLPDSNGWLQLYRTNVGPDTGPWLVSNPDNAPDLNADGTGWKNTRTSHTTGNGIRTDELWAYKKDTAAPGNSKLALYRNSLAAGVPVPGVAANGNQYFSAANRIAVTRPPAFTCTGDCTTYAPDWSRVRQILAVGDATGDGRPDLITAEDDGTGGAQLWLFSGTAATGALTAPTVIGTGGWQNYTLSTPGDVTGDGLPELWGRNTADGKLYQYPSRRNPDDTPDPTGLGSSGTRVQIGSGLFANTHPTVNSDGHITGDAAPDLWAATPAGDIIVWPGAVSGTGEVSFGTLTELTGGLRIEGETARTGGFTTQANCCGITWSGNTQAFLPAGATGTLTFSIPVDGDYMIDQFLTVAPDYGIVEVRLDDQLIGRPIDTYNPIVSTTREHQGTRHLKAGPHTLTYKTNGKNGASTNTLAGVDYVQLVPNNGGENLIGDSGFERQSDRILDGPYRTNGRAGADINVPNYTHTGANNAWVHATQPGWHKLAQPVFVKPNTTYKLSAWIETGTNNAAYFGAMRWNEGTIIKEVKLPTTRQGYTYHEITFNTGTLDRIDVYAGTWQDGADPWIRIDDLYMTPLA